LNQQKLDAAAAQQNGENKPKSLNDFVTPDIQPAADRLQQEVIARGLRYAAELPDELVTQICQEEQEKYEAEHPPEPCHKKSFAIAPEQRNDWIIAEETQKALMTRLLDMALPDGAEYQRIEPRARLMASRMIGRFCRLGQEQQFLDLRLHGQQPEVDWDEICRDIERREKESLAFHKRQEEEFYKTHPRQGRGCPWLANPEN
jgi:hypothetical protein